MRLEYLNHASVLIRTDRVALLSDPWFEGTAFSGGWGLQYQNPDAFERAAEATHLWISHWHSDHLHPPTLTQLAGRNPRLVVLANVSANFSMVDRMRGFGFDSVVPLAEREPLQIASGVSVERFPTAGIDNALLLRTPLANVFNYNDGNLPARALAALSRKIGRVDILLNNYNHAGKLYHRVADEAQKHELVRTFLAVADVIRPRLVVPFASSHYYRCVESASQNSSLLTFDDLERHLAADHRVVVLRIGDALDVEPEAWRTAVERRTPALQPQPRQTLEYTTTVPWDDLFATAQAQCVRLASGFPFLSRVTAPLRVRVSDHRRTLELDIRKGPREAADDDGDIVASSQPLHDWLGRQFGADTFIAGAHFGVVNQDTRAIERWALLTLLAASHMTERDAVGYLASGGGRGFLWSRREEIAATLLGRRLKAGQMRF